jgi:hypothetical protein
MITCGSINEAPSIATSVPGPLSINTLWIFSLQWQHWERPSSGLSRPWLPSEAQFIFLSLTNTEKGCLVVTWEGENGYLALCLMHVLVMSAIVKKQQKQPLDQGHLQFLRIFCFSLFRSFLKDY